MAEISETSAPIPARSSAFTEVGLEGHDEIIDSKQSLPRPRLQVRFRSNVSIVETDATVVQPEPSKPIARPHGRFDSAALPQMIFFILAAIMLVPAFDLRPLLSGASIAPPMAQAVAVDNSDRLAVALAKRSNSPTDICKRWSGQSALVNGTLYYYGGRSTTDPTQTSNEWSKQAGAM